MRISINDKTKYMIVVSLAYLHPRGNTYYISLSANFPSEFTFFKRISFNFSSLQETTMT